MTAREISDLRLYLSDCVVDFGTSPRGLAAKQLTSKLGKVFNVVKDGGKVSRSRAKALFAVNITQDDVNQVHPLGKFRAHQNNVLEERAALCKCLNSIYALARAEYMNTWFRDRDIVRHLQRTFSSN